MWGGGGGGHAEGLETWERAPEKKKYCENQRQEREEFIIWTLPFPRKPQGQLIPPCSWVTEQLCTQISMALVTPGLRGCSIYMPPGTETAAEAARSVLLLWSMVTPDGEARDERSWAAWAWASA